ncbi:MAG: TlpA family protein disulfide reductase [Candidatus Kapaibacterium sp.]
MSSAETLNEFSQLVVDYVNVFPNAENLYRIYSALVTGYLQVGRVQDLLGLLRRLQGVPPTVYTQIAEEIAERQDLMRDMSDSEQLEYAKDVYALGLNMIIDNTYDHMQHRPQYFTDIAWTYEGMMLEGAVYEAGGDIYYLAGEFAQANDFYINAIIIQSENATDVLYQNCINSYLKTGSPDTAYTIASRAIRYSKTNDFVYAVHDSLYHFQPDTSRAYSAVISELKNEARDRRTTHLKYALIREPAPVFTVSDPSGRVYEIGDFRGRIMISAFWASWCGPCRIMLSDLNEFYVGKKDNPDLVIAGINVWEQTTSADEDVDEFLNENDFDFPIYIDKTGILPQKFNLSGLPVAAIIDQQGFLRYKTQGYPGPEKFRQRLEDVIFLLESDK